MYKWVSTNQTNCKFSFPMQTSAKIMLLPIIAHPSKAMSFLFLFAAAVSFRYTSSAIDTLRTGDILTGNATLVSSNGMFEFGFFPAADSSDRFYLGIWYHDITPRVVVWVANRDEHFPNSSGHIKISDDNNLIVLFTERNTSWSTGLTPSRGSNYTVNLRDGGNLVMEGEGADATKRWQSFDFPTDTLLSGMKLYLNMSTGEGTRFRSWRTTSDPAGGNYTLGLDYRGVRQLVMLDESKRIRWRTGFWNGSAFNGNDRMRPLNGYGFRIFSADETNQIVFSFNYFNDTRMRFVLLPNGSETAYVYDKDGWKNIWQQPLTECESYARCGENAICDANSDRRCACLPGFEPRSRSDWERGNWSRGCERRTALQGQREDNGDGEKDGFMEIKSLKLPDEMEWDSLATDARGCEQNCLGNGSCTAYTYLPSSGCFRWSRPLLDMLRFADGESLYVRLAGSELDKKNKVEPAVIIASSIAAGVFLLLMIIAYWKCRNRIRAMWSTGSRVDDMQVTEPGNNSGQQGITIATSESGDIHSERKPFELPMFSFESVEAATDNFHVANELGRGGFGSVYKGKLTSGEEIAVKRLSRESGQGEEEFKNEMTLIAKLQHVNLVRLLGCCIKEEEKILIYEYMHNKSLDAFIFDPNKKPLLNWRSRFNIIEGVARGLLYLHRDSRLRVIHRDLKASNILLDEEMNPKISDFGMARIFYNNQNLESTNHVVGTLGYMSPEYAMEGLFSTKSDVYSFGVIVLEIITGMKSTRFRSEEDQNLLGYAWKMWVEGKGMELLDPSIRVSCNLAEVLRCIHVALLCVQDIVADRPTMSTVVMMLATEIANLPRPKHPLFSLAGQRTPLANDGLSANDLTITEVEGR